MLKYLIPRFPIRDLKPMLLFSTVASLIAGAYGIIHDQITFSISPEYFTHFKFSQFKWANLHLGDRWFVACIGFLATWWVGLITAWILCRRLLPSRNQSLAFRKIWYGIAIVFATASVFGISAYAYGLLLGPNADYSNWGYIFETLHIHDKWNFVRVGYIHNAGYLGGLTGVVLTYLLVKPEKSE